MTPPPPPYAYLALALLALAPVPAAAQGAADSAAVLAVEHAADAALVRGDAEALDTLWAADLLFRHADGTVDGRADWQRLIAAGPFFEERRADSLRVEVHGDVAVVTGRLHVRTHEPDAYRVRYLRVYARRDGRWVLVHHRSLSLSEEPPSSSANPSAVDAMLLAEIMEVEAVDNHCHCLPVDPGRVDVWDPDDPLGAPPYPAVVRLRVDNPEWARAWRALYGYEGTEATVEAARPVLRTKLQRMESLGNGYPAWVLDRAGVAVALVNADTLGLGLQGPRFRWVPFADPLTTPSSERAARLFRRAGVGPLPPTLAAYEAEVVTPVLEGWRAEGAVAVKFLTAYRRPIDVAKVDAAAAEEAYARGVEGTPSAADRRALEDHLIRYVAAEAGRLGLAVHVHTGNGVGPYFDNAGASPALLEPLLNDPALHGTDFVLIHGGWPFHELAGALTDKPNTYVDFSAQTFYLSMRALSEVLRGWLEWQPEKVLFGSDAYSDENTPLADWEEKAWLMTTTAREALALALTAMMEDGQITRERAVEIARLVLHENATRLYRL